LGGGYPTLWSGWGAFGADSRKPVTAYGAYENALLRFPNDDAEKWQPALRQRAELDRDISTGDQPSQNYTFAASSGR